MKPVLTFEHKKYSELTKKELSSINKTIDNYLSNELNKRECTFINCGIVSENLLSVKTKNVSKRKSEYYQICTKDYLNDVYNIYINSNSRNYKIKNHYKSLDSAISYAKSISLKYGEYPLFICNEKQIPIVEILLTKKEIKRKLTRPLKDNENIVKEYNFLFFGVASC